MKNLITCLTVCVLSCATFADVWTVDDDGKADFEHTHATVDTFIDSGNFITPLDERTQGACITSNERIIANEAIADYKKKNPNRSDRFIPGVLTFFPMGGRLYQDIYTQNYVDLDPSTGILDWDCTNHSYDTHKGNDTGLRSFSEQIIGVPAFSAMDGTVVHTHDGEDDMNTECEGKGNAVIIDHGNDIYGFYWHFKNGSVSVSEGDNVAAGQQIAEIASSGCSTGPHLHFELRNQAGTGSGDTIVPYSGDCNPGDSMWEEQVGIERATYIQDHGITRNHFDTWPTRPYRWPNDHQFLLSDSHQYYWFLIHNLPAKGAYSWKWYKPDGTLSYEYNNTYDYEVIYRSVMWTFYWSIGDMHQYPGTWHIEIDINGETVLDMYPEIVAELDPTFNNPPAEIELNFYPEAPTVGDVLECNILGSITNDDPDRDVLRYRYLWKVNDVVVRDIVSAAMKDVLAWNILQANDFVTIEVTPNDGYIDGSTSNLEVTIAPQQTIWTVDANGTADFTDLQSAVDAAYDGDEIIVAPGTYTNTSSEVVNMLGKEIWLRSSGGAAVTIINGEDTRRGIYCANGETAKTIVEGFTITNGYAADHGGGMYNENSSPTITDCAFQNNTSDNGGGMRNYNNSNPSLTGCTFTGNTASLRGGGMYNTGDSDSTLTDCTFTNNTSKFSGAEWGGGMYNTSSSDVTLTGTTVCNNTPNQITGSYTDGGENTIADVCPIDCASDINVDGNVNIHDLLIIINDWGACNDNCASDVNDDGEVDVNDLIILIDNWGPCE